MIQDNAKNSITFWPEDPDDPDDGVAEKPIVIEIYSDSICLEQRGNSILIQRENVDEFIRAIRKAVKAKI